MIIKCKDQTELNAALRNKKSDDEIWIVGNGFFEIYGSSQVTAYDSSQVTAYDSSQVTACDSSQVTACDSSQVTAYDSSQVRAYDSSQVRAYGSSQVRLLAGDDSSQVTACGSSQVTAYGSSQVTAYGSSQVRACDSSQVTAYDSSQVRASKQVAVTIHGKYPKVVGGVKIHFKTPGTTKEWIDNYAVETKRGIAILYKGVDENFMSPRGGNYTPGTTPEAKDWDGGKEECGGGFHFSPVPAMTLKYNGSAKKFVACPVKVSEIVVHKDAMYPDKVKAPRVCAPCYEVDINGKRVE
jgi:hypothetical protein